MIKNIISRHTKTVCFSNYRLLLIALFLSVVSFTSWSIHSAHAAVGDLLKTVDVPLEAQCVSGLGTSVAIVPGSMVDLREYSMLLVTSCYRGNDQAGKLYFLDLTSNPAALVKTINTTPAPPLGWGSLSVRGDKADLLACSNEGDGLHNVYSVDISPFNDTPDGTATLLFETSDPGYGYAICDGISWDISDDTVYHSPDVYHTTFQYSDIGDLLNTLAVPSGCPASGIAVGGTSLFVACNGVLQIHELDKSTGDVLNTFITAGTRTEDLECDPITFANNGKDAMWSKDAHTNQLFAFEIASDTCGFAGGAAGIAGKCPNGDTTDTDNDGLLDCWENDGIDTDGDGIVDLELYDVNQDGYIDSTERASFFIKDIYVEMDWMESHQLSNDALNDVVASFSDAPVDCNPVDPTDCQGVRLHFQVDEEAVAHNVALAFEPTTGSAEAGVPDFDDVKTANFGTLMERNDPNNTNILQAKQLAFHYLLSAHALQGRSLTSGVAEIFGNDFVVSLGSYIREDGSIGADSAIGENIHTRGTREQQAGTIMHELGHNLDLRHGGGDNTNCKPNYLSLMSYTRQFDNHYVNGRPLDYSRQELPALNELLLVEADGIGGGTIDKTAFGPPPIQRNVDASESIDWNGDGDTQDVVLVRNINNFDISGCGGWGISLEGHNDWNNLRLDIRNSTDFADGVHLSVLEAPEIDIADLLKDSPDLDNDGVPSLIDNCPDIANHDQLDSDGNGVGDVCDGISFAYVDIDIKPGGDPNCIKATSKGNVPIAILGSTGFDVTTIDTSTLEIDGVAPKRTAIKDVNRDGVIDLMTHVSTQLLNDVGAFVDGGVLTVTGQLLSGAPFIGLDNINLAGGPYCH